MIRAMGCCTGATARRPSKLRHDLADQEPPRDQDDGKVVRASHMDVPNGDAPPVAQEVPRPPTKRLGEIAAALPQRAQEGLRRGGV